MAIRSFAALRNELRRIESTDKQDAITPESLPKWRASLKAAVDDCYTNPITLKQGETAPFDWEGMSRHNVRRSAPLAPGHKETEHAKTLRRTAIDEMLRPAIVLLKSGKKGVETKALNGLRTCAEAACANLIRVYADQTDDTAAQNGASGKLRLLAEAFKTQDPRSVIARLGEAIDPAHLLSLELGATHPATRVVSHEGSARFQQALDSNRPLRVTSFTVTFSGPVASPPLIQTVFINEQLVDAFWDWKEDEAPTAASEKHSPTKDANADEATKPAPAVVRRTIKLGKAQNAVRSWSVVIASDHVAAIEAEVDATPTTILPNIAALNGNTNNIAEVIVTPGNLSTAPLLRDVVTASLRHFHGPTVQDKFTFVVQHSVADSTATTVYVGAAHGASKSAKFHHAGASVHVVETPAEIAPADVKTTTVPALSKRGLPVIAKVATLQALLVLIARHALKLRAKGVIALLVAGWAAFVLSLRHLGAARRLMLGAPVPKTTTTSSATLKRLIAVFSHALAQATATPATAASTAARKALVAALRLRALPFGRFSLGDIDKAIDRIAAAKPLVGELKPDALAAMGVASTFPLEDEAKLKDRAAIAAMMYAAVPSLRSCLSEAIAKDIAKAAAPAVAKARDDCDVVARQASLLKPEEVLRLAGRCEPANTIVLPPTPLQRDSTGLHTLVFSTDRSGVVTAMDRDEANAVASLLFTLAL